MKIGKRTVSFTGETEIDDLKLAIRLAAAACKGMLERRAENLRGHLELELAENNNNMEDAISSMFDITCQGMSILDFAKELSLLEEKEMRIIIKNFTSIREFCEKEMAKLNKQL